MITVSTHWDDDGFGIHRLYATLACETCGTEFDCPEYIAYRIPANNYPGSDSWNQAGSGLAENAHAYFRAATHACTGKNGTHGT